MASHELKVNFLETNYQRAFQAAKDAQPHDPAKAADLYEHAAGLADHLAGATQGKTRTRYLAQAEQLRTHAHAVRTGRTRPRTQGRGPTSGAGAPGQDGPSSPGDRASEDEGTATREGAEPPTDASGFIEQVKVKWDDIAGLDDPKRVLKEAVALAVARAPAGVRVEAPTGVLLYGPPGTGKTMLAAAACGSLGATFYNVPLAKVENKYFGESPKIVRTVFEDARKREPSIVFLDDIDTLVTSRGDDKSHGASRGILGTLLTEMDGLGSKGKGPKPVVLVLAGTNEPWSLDEALMSRFTRKIYLPLPEERTRRAILDKLLKDRGFTLAVPLDEVVSRTAGYSGRELRNLAQTLVNRMLSDANPDLLEKGTMDEFRAYELKVTPISRDQTDYALAKVRPGTDARTIERLEAWHDQ